MSIEHESQPVDNHQVLSIERSVVETIGSENALRKENVTTMWELGAITGALPKEAREMIIGLYWKVFTAMAKGQDLTIKIEGIKLPDWMFGWDIEDDAELE